jgi:hypothetical protein
MGTPNWTPTPVRPDGEYLTSASYQTDRQQAANGDVPQVQDDYSATLTEMQTAVDPAPGGAPSLPTTLAGELERVRFALRQIKQVFAPAVAQWYEPLPAVTIPPAGAPVSAAFLTLSLDATLTAERRLVAGTGITLTDGGPNGDLTIASTATGGGAPLDASYVTLTANPTLTNESVLTAGAGLSLAAATVSVNGPATTALLDVFTSTLKGLTPASGGGTLNYLRADGTWAAPSGSGAPINAPYVTTAADPTLTNESVLAATAPIALTGSTLSLNDDGVTDLKLRNSVGLSVIGRSVQTTGDPADIVAGADGDLLQRQGASLVFAALPGHYVTSAMFRTSTALSVVGRPVNTTGDVSDLAASLDGQILRRSGTSLGFGALNLASANAVTGILPAANMDPAFVSSGGIPATIVDVKGDLIAASAADTVVRLPVGTNGQVLTADSAQASGLAWTTPTTGGASTAASYVTIGAEAGLSAERQLVVTSPITLTDAGANSTATLALADDGVTNLKLRNSAGLSVIGNGTNASADPGDLVAASDFQVLRRSGTALAFGAVNLASANAVTGVLPAANMDAAFVGALADNGTTNAKLADMLTARLKGRVTAGTGDPEDLTGTQATTLLDVFTSALKGLAPSSGGGTTNFLRADGTWAVPAGGAGGAPVDASYLTIAADATLTAERTLAAGAGLALADGGANAAATLSVATAGVTSAMLRNSVGLSVIGRALQTTGVPGDITAGTDGDLLQRQGASLVFAALPADSVTNTILRNSTNLSVIGRSVNTAGDPADIQATADDQVLRRSGTSLGFGTVATGGMADNAVTNAKLADMVTARIKGRVTAATGDPEDLTGTQATTLLDVFGTLKGLVPGTASSTTNYLRADGTWAVPPGAGGGAPTDAQYLTLAADATLSAERVLSATAPVALATTATTATLSLNDDGVTDAKLRNSAGTSVIGRSAGTSGDPADIAASADGQVLRRAAGALGFGAVDLADTDAVTGVLPVANVNVTTLQPKLALDQWLQWDTSNTIRRTTAGSIELTPVDYVESVTGGVVCQNSSWFASRKTDTTLVALLVLDGSNVVQINPSALPITIWGTITANGVARATGHVTGANGALASGYVGIASCTRASTGTYSVVWSANRSSTTYPVVATAKGGTAAQITVDIDTTQAVVRTFNASGTITDRDFMIAAF